MQREVAKLFHDVLVASQELDGFLNSATMEKFYQDRSLQLIAEREFEIIGEALARLRRLDKDLIDQIPDSLRIIGMRNVITHGYDVLDYEILWDAYALHLPQLIHAIKQLSENS